MSFRYSIFYFLFLFSIEISAQPLAAYVDMQNQVMVWDKGMIRKVDYLPPVLMKTGRTAIPYLDNSRSFKIYYGGGVRTLNIGFTNEFYATDNLVGFLNAKSLNVFERGTVKNLSGLCLQYFIGDSIILFQDGVRNEFKAYYDGTIYPIENFLAGQGLEAIKVSDNIAAYDNYANQFKIFYRGEIFPQEDFVVTNFDVGRNTVAYVDINREFKIFHKGKTVIAEDFPPESYMVGDDIVAYVSNDGYFKIFYDDSVRKIGFFKPDYQVGDYVVGYKDPSGYFKSFYKGNITILESYYPSNYEIQYNSIAYINRAGMLRLFSKGEIYDVATIYATNSEGSQQNWELHYDVLKYNVGLNLFKVFYDGTEY